MGFAFGEPLTAPNSQRSSYTEWSKQRLCFEPKACIKTTLRTYRASWLYDIQLANPLTLTADCTIQNLGGNQMSHCSHAPRHNLQVLKRWNIPLLIPYTLVPCQDNKCIPMELERSNDDEAPGQVWWMTNWYLPTCSLCGSQPASVWQSMDNAETNLQLALRVGSLPWGSVDVDVLPWGLKIENAYISSTILKTHVGGSGSLICTAVIKIYLQKLMACQL